MSDQGSPMTPPRVVVKKIPNENISLLDILSEKEVIITVSSLNGFSEVVLPSSSIMRLFSLIDKNIENALCTYLTCIIDSDSNNSTTEYELDPIYVELLRKSKCFFITPTNKKNTNIMMSSYSLKKVATFLQTDIPGLCDYISVAIFIFTNEELYQRQKSINRLSLKAGLMAKNKNPSSVIEFADIPNDPELMNISGILDKSNNNNENNVSNNSNNDKNSKLYSNHKKLLLSRQRLSRGKIYPSPGFSSSNNSRNKDFEASYEDHIHITSPTNQEGGNQNRLRTRPVYRKKKQSSRSTYGYDFSNLYLLNDNEGNFVLVTEDTFDVLWQAKEKGKIKPDGSVTVFDVENKAVSVDVENIDLIKDDIDKKMISVPDLNGKKVVLNSRKFEEMIEQMKKEDNDIIEIDDYTGTKAFIQVPFTHAKKILSSQFKTAKKMQKKFYIIRLARIEVNDISNYYANN